MTKARPVRSWQICWNGSVRIFLNSVQVFGVIIVEAIVFLALIAFVYRRQEI